MGHTARNPRRARGWQQAQLLRQGNARAALAGKQQLPALMLMQARIVVTEGCGDADDRCGKLSGSKCAWASSQAMGCPISAINWQGSDSTTVTIS
jgi:hypothetical protein